MGDPVVQNYPVEGDQDGSTKKVTWTLTTADHTGTAVKLPEWADRTIQFGGTWGGATAIVEGSQDNVLFGGLSNAAGGAAISKTADAGPVSIIELPIYMRPRLSVVGAGATVTATLLLRRANPMRT